MAKLPVQEPSPPSIDEPDAIPADSPFVSQEAVALVGSGSGSHLWNQDPSPADESWLSLPVNFDPPRRLEEQIPDDAGWNIDSYLGAEL